MSTPGAPKRGRALLRADGGPLGEKFAQLIDAVIHAVLNKFLQFA